MTLEELRDALANATGPDRELDFPIHCLRMDWKWEGGFSTDKAARDELYQKGLIPEYTASIDAAATLVPKYHGREWFWRIGSGSQDAGWCHLNRVDLSNCDRGDEIHAVTATPALALCLARVEYELQRAATPDGGRDGNG